MSRPWSSSASEAVRRCPRAAHFHLRTLELFRAAGIEEAVKEQSEKEFVPEGAIVAMDSLSGRKLADIIPSLNVGVDDALTPCRRLFVSQPGLEPILRAKALTAGAVVLEGHEVVGAEQDDEGVTVTVRDVDSGAEQTRRGRYLVAADGAHSTVREALGIPFDGRGTFSNSITIYFTADLWPQLGGKPLGVIYINNPTFGGFFRLDKACQAGFLVVNTVGDPATNPDAANAAADTSEERLIELVRIGAGVPDLPVRIDGVARWRASSDVARRYQDGRIFLAGDAAHVMPPNGGFGGNTGILDAYDLAWKLAFVVKGLADPRLLDTYEAERRPVGVLTVEQAYSRYVTRTAPYLGATDYQPIAADLEVELGCLYRSPAISADADDGAVHADPRQTRARPGSRAPHLWVSVTAGGSPRWTCSVGASCCSPGRVAPAGARRRTSQPLPTPGSSWRCTASAVPTCRWSTAPSATPTTCRRPVPCSCGRTASSPGGPGPTPPRSAPRWPRPCPPRSMTT